MTKEGYREGKTALNVCRLIFLIAVSVIITDKLIDFLDQKTLESKQNQQLLYFKSVALEKDIKAISCNVKGEKK